jgi:hypothetical protein
LIIRAKRDNYLFLNGGALGDFLVHNFEDKVIHVEGYGGSVFELEIV